jgi:chromosome segregation ATPase
VTTNEKMEAEIKTLRDPSETGDEPYRPLTAEITSLREENVTLLSRMNDEREVCQRELRPLKENARRAAEENDGLRAQLAAKARSVQCGKRYTEFRKLPP